MILVVFIEIINSESERLTRLINDVLDLARIEAGRMPWQDNLISIQDIINNTARVQHQLLEEKSLRLNLDVAQDLPLVLADRDRIQTGHRSRSIRTSAKTPGWIFF